MHTHVSGLTAAYIFLMVVLAGTFWRLGAAWAVTRGGFTAELGKAMAFQF
jgi:hypothetical protein